MHRALLIPSRYPEGSGYPNEANWGANSDQLGLRLHQYGYAVTTLDAGEELVNTLRSALRDLDKGVSLLFYFCGYLVLTEDGEPALVLSDESATALRLSQLAARAGRNAGRVLFLLDAVRGAPGRVVQAHCKGREFASSEQALGALCTEVTFPPNVGMLLGIRRWGEDQAGLPLSEVLDSALADLATSEEPCVAGDVADWVLERSELLGCSTHFLAPDPDFVVLPRRRVPSVPHRTIAINPEPAPRVRSDRARGDTLPPPLPGERANATPSAETAILPPPVPVGIVTEAAVPPPPPLPLAAAEMRAPLPPPPPPPLAAQPMLSIGPSLAPPLPPLSPQATLPAPPPLPPSFPPPALQPSFPPPPPLPDLRSLVPPAPTPGTHSTLQPDANEQGPRESIPARTPRVASPEFWPPGPEHEPPTATVRGPGGARDPLATGEIPEPRDEAALLQRIKQLLAEGNGPAATAEAFECLAAFPESAEALQIAAQQLANSGRWQELVMLYEDLAARVPTPGNQAQLLVAAARIFRQQFRDPERARTLLGRALSVAPQHVNLLLELSELEAERGDLVSATELARRALQESPLDPRCSRWARPLFHQQRPDLSLCASVGLEFLGEIPRGAGHEQDSVRDLPQPRQGLTIDQFRLGLELSTANTPLQKAINTLSPALRNLALPKAKVQQKLQSTLKVEDVAQSTATLTRVFGWTCRLFGVTPPPLSLMDGDAPPEPLPLAQVHWGVGKSLGRGLSLAELAFIWGRALGRARPENRVLLDYPRLEDLECAINAARSAAGLNGQFSEAETRLAKALRKAADRATLESAGALLSTISEHHLTAELTRFHNASEFSANRFGLVACNAVDVAVHCLERLPSTGPSREAQVADLIRYALSPEFQTLRAALGLL